MTIIVKKLEGENVILSDKLELISFKNLELFKKVFSRVLKARTSLIIGTYNLQDIRIRDSSLSEVLKKLSRRDVKTLICLAPFMQKSQFVQNFLYRSRKVFFRFCRRMHFKTIIVDLDYAYIGTANLSGAGVGMKSERRRNFELGFVTRDTNIIADIAATFMDIFNGKYCSSDKCHFYNNFRLKDPCYGMQ